MCTNCFASQVCSSSENAVLELCNRTVTLKQPLTREVVSLVISPSSIQSTPFWLWCLLLESGLFDAVNKVLMELDKR